MDLRDYVRAIRKRWWMVAAATIFALGATAIITARMTPLYATTLTFFITTPNSSVSNAYQGNLFSEQRVKSYQDLLTSDRLATAVIEAHPVGLTGRQVRERITARAVPDSVLLEATVTDPQSQRARAIAQHLAAQFAKLVETLETPPGSTTPTVKVEVISGPETSSEPVSPRPLRNAALGLVIGLLAGASGAVLKDALDTTLKNKESLQEAASAPVLASVPFDPIAKQAPLIVADRAEPARAESLRQLRTNLQFLNVDEPVRTITFTSAVPSEGKSSTACNMAIVLAEAGHRVLLVDADLRRPQVSTYLGLEGSLGLTNVLAGQATLDQVLQPWGSMWVLAAGSSPPNPSELLGSQNMATMLLGLATRFDRIVIDTPPLLPVTDAAVVAAHTDATILVARYGKTTTAQVRTAAAALAAVHGRLFGCVLNMTPRKHARRYPYYGYEYSYQPRPNHRQSTVVATQQQAAAPTAITVSGSAPAGGPAGTVSNNGQAGELIEI